MSDMIDPRAEMLAKEIQMIVAAERWKGRNLSATPPEKWHRLRPETQQLWIDEASRILAALPPAPDAVGACGGCGNADPSKRCFGCHHVFEKPDAVEALVKAEHTRLSMTPAQFANMERWRGYTEGLDAMRDAALSAIRGGSK